jgi:hypothetical protein
MRKDRAPWLETLALFLLLAGSVFVPWGWLVGVVLAWSSRIWTLRDKLIATLCPPFGLAPAIWIVFGGVGSSELCSGGSTSVGRVWEHCTGGPSPVMQVVWIAVAAILFLLPFATSLYLNHRARRPPGPGPAFSRA